MTLADSQIQTNVDTPSLDHQFASWELDRLHYSRASRPTMDPSHPIYPLITHNDSPHQSCDRHSNPTGGGDDKPPWSGPPGRTIEILIKQHELGSPDCRRPRRPEVNQKQQRRPPPRLTWCDWRDGRWEASEALLASI
jgi:hypothetical protein